MLIAMRESRVSLLVRTWLGLNRFLIAKLGDRVREEQYLLHSALPSTMLALMRGRPRAFRREGVGSCTDVFSWRLCCR